MTVYDVTLTIEGDDQLKLGMNGTATILVEERENVLLVPIAALKHLPWGKLCMAPVRQCGRWRARRAHPRGNRPER